MTKMVKLKALKKRSFITLMLLLLFPEAGMPAGGKTAYVMFNSHGRKISVERMVQQLASADIILFGELHNNPISHWIQYELVESLSRGNNLILGAEMFEADNQEALTSYVEKQIDRKALDTLVRLWPNFKTDYEPLVNFARDHKLRFIATNIPRRFANMVFKNDFAALDILSGGEKKWIAPLPIEYDPSLPGYIAMKDVMGGHSGETLPKAQAIKDATMAYFIVSNLEKGKKFIHFNGAYHSENHEGIVWYLKRLRPDLKIKTITTVSLSDPRSPEATLLKKADFIICVDENMTTTY